MSDTKEKVQETTEIPEAVKDAVEADLQKLNDERDSGLRTFKRRGGAQTLYVSDLFKLPEDFSLANLAPTSYLAQPEGPITGNLETQRFSLIEERLKGMTFDQPGREIERNGRLKVVKALKPTGVLSQLPLSQTHNNAAAGNEEDMIGMRVYTKKGYLLLWDHEANLPVFCFARNCWAAAMREEMKDKFPQHMDVVNTGYCSYDHLAFIEPRKAKDAPVIGKGMFESGITTTRSRT